MLLKLAIQLGLAEIIHAHTQQNPEGITVTQLAKSSPFDHVHVQNLGRIMLCMVHMGLLQNPQPPPKAKKTSSSPPMHLN